MKLPWAGRAGIAVAVLCLSWQAAAEPASRPLVQLEIEDCAAVDGRAVRQLVGIELGALLTDGPEHGGDTTRVTVRCRDRLLELHLDDPITGKTLSRVIDLRVLAEGTRARLLALAIAELVTASWVELLVNPRPVVPPAAAAPSPAARRAALALVARQVPSFRSPRIRIAGLLGGQTFLSGLGLLYGGGLRLSTVGGRIAGAIDAVVFRETVSMALGTVTVDTVTLAPAILWAPVSPLRLGAAVHAGIATLTGAPRSTSEARGGTVGGMWVGLAFTVEITLFTRNRFALGLVGQGGEVLVPVRGRVSGMDELSVGGPWLGGQLALGILL